MQTLSKFAFKQLHKPLLIASTQTKLRKNNQLSKYTFSTQPPEKEETP